MKGGEILKKNLLPIVGTVLFGSICLAVAVSASNGFHLLTKGKQAVLNSIDPATEAPVQNFMAKAYNKKAERKHFIAEDTGKEIDLPYVKSDKKDVVVYDPISTLWTTPIPGTANYLVAFDGTIYLAEWESGKLKNFLKDEVSGYKKDDVVSKKIEHVGTLLWGAYPAVSPNGSYVLFYSERSMLKDDPNGQLWVKDMSSGNEKPIFSGNGTVLGWLNRESVVLSSQNTILLNVQTGETKTLIEGVTSAALVNDQLVHQSSPGTLTIQSVATGESTNISSHFLNRVGSFESRGAWVALHNQIKDGEADFNIVLYNLETKKWKLISAPSTIWIEGLSWADDNTLLIQTSTKGTHEETTYLVHINKL
jgi:Tol biopolymer transport system component